MVLGLEVTCAEFARRVLVRSAECKLVEPFLVSFVLGYC